MKNLKSILVPRWKPRSGKATAFAALLVGSSTLSLAGFAQTSICATNRLVNSSFEVPVQTGTGNHILGTGVNVSGWRLEGTARSNVVKVDGTLYQYGPNTAKDGSQYLDIADAGSTLIQIFEISCPTAFSFGGSFSSRNFPNVDANRPGPVAAGTSYNNWTGKFEILTISGTIVATSANRSFVETDADSYNPVTRRYDATIDAQWYTLSGTTATLPAGRYIFRITMGDGGNVDETYLCITNCFKPFDADNDTYINLDDLDSDDDGIRSIVENRGIDPYADADKDGIPNYTDASPGTLSPAFVDANNDGINDFWDADLDGLINSEDLDSDNDGIPDIIEAGGVDVNGDGKVDDATDANANGWRDVYDTAATNGINLRLLDANGSGIAGGLVFDFDGDGIPNFLDLDSDNDGIPDIIEQGGTDSNNDGKADVSADVDGDGFLDMYDPVNNNTGVVLGTPIITTGSTRNTFNLPAAYSAGDNLDGTSLINMLDLDADGDGITDVREASFAESATTAGFAAGTIGANGWSTTVSGSTSSALALPNTDSRGQANYLDIDADDDGIIDNVEGQATASYVLPAGTDTDADGIDDAYESTTSRPTLGGTGIVPVNTDNTDVADYLDLDSDNDNISDLKEGYGDSGFSLTAAQLAADADGDGLIDVFDTFNILSAGSSLYSNVVMKYMGTNGDYAANPALYGSDNRIYKTSTISSADRDWRNAVIILPVKLIRFTVAYDNKASNLNWLTANEEGHERYMVERSTDGVNFVALTTISARGSNGDYTFTDNAIPAVAILYYRLKTINQAGTVSYSGILPIKLTLDKAALTLYPNPVKDVVALSFNSPARQTVFVQVYNTKGAQVLSKTYTVQKGSNTLQITEWDKFSPGNYLIEVGNDSFRLSRKVVHLH